MSEEIFFDGVQYTPAASAARTVARTRDYIAHICKEGKVRGRRVGKNWYVDIAQLRRFLVEQESLLVQRREELSRRRAEEYQAHRSSDLIEPQIIDGVKYIAAADAAKESGLTRDYIARLCREEKVTGVFAGNIWYVDVRSLQSFLITQEFEKRKRHEALARRRAREYRRDTVVQNSAFLESRYKGAQQIAEKNLAAHSLQTFPLTDRSAPLQPCTKRHFMQVCPPHFS